MLWALPEDVGDPGAMARSSYCIVVRRLMHSLFRDTGAPFVRHSLAIRSCVLCRLSGGQADVFGVRLQLLALEWLLGVGMPDKLKEAPLAVKALYDEDIADEVRAPSPAAHPVIGHMSGSPVSLAACAQRRPCSRTSMVVAALGRSTNFSPATAELCAGRASRSW